MRWCLCANPKGLLYLSNLGVAHTTKCSHHWRSEVQSPWTKALRVFICFLTHSWALVAQSVWAVCVMSQLSLSDQRWGRGRSCTHGRERKEKSSVGHRDKPFYLVAGSALKGRQQRGSSSRSGKAAVWAWRYRNGQVVIIKGLDWQSACKLSTADMW